MSIRSNSWQYACYSQLCRICKQICGCPHRRLGHVTWKPLMLCKSVRYTAEFIGPCISYIPKLYLSFNACLPYKYGTYVQCHGKQMKCQHTESWLTPNTTTSCLTYYYQPDALETKFSAALHQERLHLIDISFGSLIVVCFTLVLLGVASFIGWPILDNSLYDCCCCHTAWTLQCPA